MAGPLTGCRVVEMAGIGPVPFTGMVLADLGADVVRVDRLPRAGAGDVLSGDPLARGRRSVSVDLKHPDGTDVVLSLVEAADVLLEGFRPGVMERLGLGPDVCHSRNAALVYGRMTGFGQEGPLAHVAGHDINYLAVSGVLHHIGREGSQPVPPLNLVGDFGGGGMLLAVGVLAALLVARHSGHGDVIDAAMVDGAALLMASMYGVRAEGRWRDERGTNLIDSGAPFYDVYLTSDGALVSVGALERPFYAALLSVCGIEDEWPDRFDRTVWPAMRDRLAAAFRTRTLSEWCEAFEGRDACFAPVLAMGEAPEHAHNRSRNTFVAVDRVLQPAPAPRLAGHPAAVPRPGPSRIGQHTDVVLAAAGFDADQRDALRRSGVIL